MGDGDQLGTNDDFVKNLTDVLQDPEHLYECVTKESDRDVIQSVAWDLITAVMTHLKDSLVTEKLELYGKVLMEISKLPSPKELYLGILEHFDPDSDSRHVELLIPALSVVLQKLCSEDLAACAVVLETTYSTVSYYTESLNVPNYNDYNPSSKKKDVFEATKILKFLEKFMATLRPVAEKICQNKESVLDYEKFKRYSFQFTCCFLAVLAQLDVDLVPSSKDENTATPVHIVCHDVMKMSAMFHSPQSLSQTNNWILLHPVNETTKEGRIEIAMEVERSRACYFFVLLCRGVLAERLAKIFSPQFLLARTVSALDTFLSCSNQAVVWKGLEILSYILDRTSPTSFSYREIFYIFRTTSTENSTSNSKNPVFAVFQRLINVAVSLPSKTIRSKAIQLLIPLIDAFLWEDKYILLVQLLKTSEHAGVNGILIGFLKDKLDKILRDLPPKGFESFCDKRKMNLLGNMIFFLPHGTETDLLEDSDRLMPALNLLRFLLIRDKGNKTGVFDNLTEIKTKFLKPIRSALDLSRTHYENELGKYENKRRHKGSADTGFTVNGMPLPNIPYEDQKKTLRSALHTFDMIEIVTVRVQELTEARACLT